MLSTKIKINNPQGIHARPALRIVDVCKSIDSKVSIINGNLTADGRSILELLLLGAVTGTEVEIVAEGKEEELALRMIAELFDEP